jgi:uncharacterized membrane protein YkoI
MRIRSLALTAIALACVPAFAVVVPLAGEPRRLAEVAAQMEARYPGEVVAIAADTSADQGPHYHVDMRFPSSGLARLDVDARTLAIGSRESTFPVAGSATLLEAVALVAANLPGQVTLAELDATASVTAHYDIDVRLPEHGVARLAVDAATRAITWRSPHVVAE